MSAVLTHHNFTELTGFTKDLAYNVFDIAPFLDNPAIIPKGVVIEARLDPGSLAKVMGIRHVGSVINPQEAVSNQLKYPVRVTTAGAAANIEILSAPDTGGLGIHLYIATEFHGDLWEFYTTMTVTAGANTGTWTLNTAVPQGGDMLTDVQSVIEVAESVSAVQFGWRPFGSTSVAQYYSQTANNNCPSCEHIPTDSLARFEFNSGVDKAGSINSYNIGYQKFGTDDEGQSFSWYTDPLALPSSIFSGIIGNSTFVVGSLYPTLQTLGFDARYACLKVRTTPPVGGLSGYIREVGSNTPRRSLTSNNVNIRQYQNYWVKLTPEYEFEYVLGAHTSVFIDDLTIYVVGFLGFNQQPTEPYPLSMSKHIKCSSKSMSSLVKI